MGDLVCICASGTLGNFQMGRGGMFRFCLRASRMASHPLALHIKQNPREFPCCRHPHSNAEEISARRGSSELHDLFSLWFRFSRNETTTTTNPKRDETTITTLATTNLNEMKQIPFVAAITPFLWLPFAVHETKCVA